VSARDHCRTLHELRASRVTRHARHVRETDKRKRHRLVVRVVKRAVETDYAVEC